MTHPTPIINPLTLSPEARQANAEREQHEAQAEGLLYIETEHQGAVSQYWVKYHQRLRWEVLKSKQGGVFWQPDTERTEIHRPGGVKAAAAAAAQATAEQPKTPRRSVQADER